MPSSSSVRRIVTTRIIFAFLLGTFALLFCPAVRRHDDDHVRWQQQYTSSEVFVVQAFESKPPVAAVVASRKKFTVPPSHRVSLPALQLQSSSSSFPARIIGRRKQQQQQQSQRHSCRLKRLLASSNNNDNHNDNDDVLFNGETTVTLIGGQALLVGVAAIAATIIGTPNFGLGPHVEFTWSALQVGTIFALPLGILAIVLDVVEEYFPALEDVTKATQRSVLALMGGTFKPRIALVIAIALGVAAGLGEELLFRGVVQYELSNRWGEASAIALSSVVFGLLHAVTPLYAFLASLASVYFGILYSWTDNLAIPIACHTIYDIGALWYAHYTVSQLSVQERLELSQWEGPTDKFLDPK